MTGVNMMFFIGGPQLGELEAGLRRAMGRAGGLGRQRRHRLPDRDGVGRGGDARAARLPSHRAAAGARPKTIDAKRKRGQL